MLKGNRSRFALPAEDGRHPIAEVEQGHMGLGRPRGRPLGSRNTGGRGRGSRWVVVLIMLVCM
jgi:hypothetical protein